MDSEQAKLRFKEADSLFRQGHYPDALQLLAELNREYPDTRHILFPMALCYEKLERFEEALDLCDRIIEHFNYPKAEELRVRLVRAQVAAAAGQAPPSPGEAKTGQSYEPIRHGRPLPEAPPSSVKMIALIAGIVIILALLAVLPFLVGGASTSPELEEGVAQPPAAAMMATAILVLVLCIGLYLFSCYVLKLICEKAGSEPGCLVWVPVLQILPLLDAAGMSYLWILAFFLGPLGLVATVLLWIKLCEARGKPGWLGILVLIPFANLALPLYLAFSD